MFDALAYIDPGSGSLIVQAIIASLVAVPFIFRQQIARAVRMIRRDAGPESSAPGDTDANPTEPDA